MRPLYDIPGTKMVRTAYKDFYTEVKSKNYVKFEYQLFAFAFMVGLLNDAKSNSPKTKDICRIQNIDKHMWRVMRAAAILKLKCEDGDSLFGEMLEIADGGIELLMQRHDLEDELSLAKFIE